MEKVVLELKPLSNIEKDLIVCSFTQFDTIETEGDIHTAIYSTEIKNVSFDKLQKLFLCQKHSDFLIEFLRLSGFSSIHNIDNTIKVYHRKPFDKGSLSALKVYAI